MDDGTEAYVSQITVAVTSLRSPHSAHLPKRMTPSSLNSFWEREKWRQIPRQIGMDLQGLCDEHRLSL